MIKCNNVQEQAQDLSALILSGAAIRLAREKAITAAANLRH